VAVLDFEYEPMQIHMQGQMGVIQVNNPGKLIADSMTTAIMKSGFFTVIERTQLQRILSEQNLSMSDVVNSGDYQVFGKILDVDAIIVGTVSSMSTYAKPQNSYESQLIFSCRAIDLDTGVIIWTLEASEKTNDSNPGNLLKKTMNEISQELRDKVTKRVQDINTAASLQAQTKM